MKKTFVLILLFIFIGLSGYSQNSIRLMTYNIRNSFSIDYKQNVQRIANLINNSNPDVIALQEIDSVINRSDNTYILGDLAERTQMHAYFAPAVTHDAGKYGVGILSKKKPIRVESIFLPGREEKRVLLLAEFDDYVYCSTHLSLVEEDQIASLPLLKSFMRNFNKPIYIAGEFNSLPNSTFINELKKDFNIVSNIEEYTFPPFNLTKMTNYIVSFKEPNRLYSVMSTEVLADSIATDHYPILAVIRLAQNVNKIFTTFPYLQNPTQNGITVMCETSVPAYVWLEYGTDSLHLERVRTLVDGQTVCNGTLHKIRLENLQPGITYYYRVCSREILQYQAYYKEFGYTARTKFKTFKLPNKTDDTFTAVIFNDLHKHSSTFRALCNVIANIDYDFVVFNGDCLDDPFDKDEASKFISELTIGVKASQVPVFFMRGNHEIRNAYSINLRNHFDYINDKTYGAFSWGDTRIVMLDCGEDKDDNHWVYYGLNDFTQFRKEQAEFLKKEVSSKIFKKSVKRILIHHIPLYGNEGDNLCDKLWMPILKKSTFDLSINAHTHSFAYYPKEKLGNNYPVIIGGGFEIDNATVIILTKKKNMMDVKVMNAKGEILLNEIY